MKTKPNIHDYIKKALPSLTGDEKLHPEFKQFIANQYNLYLKGEKNILDHENNRI